MRRDIRREKNEVDFHYIRHYPLLLAAFQKPPPFSREPAQVQVLRYIPDIYIVNNLKEKKKREANIH